MSALGVWLQGVRRVRRAKSLVLLLWFATIAVTIPPAIELHNAVKTHLGASLEADSAADGVNFDWLQEFRAQADPLGRSLRPDVIGFAAVMDNTSALADVSQRPVVALTAGAIFVVLMWFLSSGCICRLAVDRRLGAGGFAACCAAFLGRMLRLNVVALFLYSTLVGSFHQWLFDDVFEAVTKDLTVERTAFFIRVACYALFFLLLAACNVLFDFAKVRLVVEDRRSVLFSIVAGAHFVLTNARLALGVYAMNVLALGGVIGLYWMSAPGAGGAGASMWVGFLVSQIYIASRVFVKLAFWGSEVVALNVLPYRELVFAPAAAPMTTSHCAASSSVIGSTSARRMKRSAASLVAASRTRFTYSARVP